MRKNSNGFTLVELVVVMAIVLMLAAAAITGSIGLLRGLRFSNTFNKLVLMTQQARSLASTGRGADNISAYGIELTEHQLILFSEAPKTIIDSFALDQTQSIQFFARYNNLPCPFPTNIRFAKGNAETTFVCTGNDPAILQFGVIEEQNNGQTREKSFVIHRVSGIPQVQ